MNEKMSGPAFSVIIAVYNGDATLSRAIDSVLMQSYLPHEAIVVDDGSSDGTAEIAKGDGDRGRFLRQHIAGVAAARNAGVQAATGDWRAFRDADDWYYPDRLRLHAEWICEDGALDFLTGDYDYVADNGRILSRTMETQEAGRLMLAKANGAPRIVMSFEVFVPFVSAHFGDTLTISVPRKRFIEAGGYPTGYKVCEDVFLLTKLCAASRRIGVICTPLAAYVIHEKSATRKDALAAQSENVRTLVALKQVSAHFPPAIRRGVVKRLSSARLNLGYALVRNGFWVVVLCVVALSFVVCLCLF